MRSRELVMENSGRADLRSFRRVQKGCARKRKQSKMPPFFHDLARGQPHASKERTRIFAPFWQCPLLLGFRIQATAIIQLHYQINNLQLLIHVRILCYRKMNSKFLKSIYIIIMYYVSLGTYYQHIQHKHFSLKPLGLHTPHLKRLLSIPFGRFTKIYLT